MSTDNVSVKILLFAKAKEIVGKNEINAFLPIGPYSADTLKKEVINICKELQIIAANFILAINEEYIDCTDNLFLKNGDCVAVIPPLSGG